MALSLSDLKDLISFGNELGLQQLQTEGLVVVYGQKISNKINILDKSEESDTTNILAHYSAIGRERLNRK